MTLYFQPLALSSVVCWSVVVLDIPPFAKGPRGLDIHSPYSLPLVLVALASISVSRGWWK